MIRQKYISIFAGSLHRTGPPTSVNEHASGGMRLIDRLRGKRRRKQTRRYIPKPTSASVFESSLRIHSSWSRLMMRFVVYAFIRQVSCLRSLCCAFRDWTDLRPMRFRIELEGILYITSISWMHRRGLRRAYQGRQCDTVSTQAACGLLRSRQKR